MIKLFRRSRAPRLRRFPRAAPPLAAWLLLLPLAAAPRLLAAEPSEAFLQQLRAAGYFDTALAYLDRIDRYPAVPEEFRSAVQLERAQTLIAMGSQTRTKARRDEAFQNAEAALEAFVQEQPQHPRFAEARLQLGNLQLMRGVAQIESSDDPDETARAEARQSFDAAAATFDAIAADVREQIRALQGARIDREKEPEKAAQRDRLASSYMQALLLGGDARLRSAQTLAADSDEGKQKLEDARQRFAELMDKYDRYLPGIQAQRYLADVQRLSGQPAAALDNYLGVLGQGEADALRAEKFRAARGAVELWLENDPPQTSLATERGQAVLDGVRPNERQSPEVQQLRLALAQAYLRHAELSKQQRGGDGAARRATTSARQALQAAVRVPGPHQNRARRLLAEMGVEREETPDIEVPENFDEALAAARKLIEGEGTEMMSIKLLDEQLAQGEGDTEQLEKERAAAAERLDQERGRGVAILRSALSNPPADADAETLNQARYYLTYFLFRRGQYREAAVVGGFVARRFPSSPVALQSGMLGMTALQTLLQDLPEDQQAGPLRELGRLGEHIIAQWPDDTEAANSRGVLVRVALADQRWEDARRLMEGFPEDSPQRAELQLRLGEQQWNRYLRTIQKGDDEEARQVLEEARESLRAALEGIGDRQVQPDTLRGALLLAKAQIRLGEPAAALATLDDPRTGPLQRLGDVSAPQAHFAADLYGTALQAIVGRLSEEDADASALLERAGEMMEKLRGAFDGSADGNRQLVGTYFRLAGDIRDQLESAPPERRESLVGAFRLFLDQLAQQTDDAETLRWVGQTLSEMGQSMVEPPGGTASGQAAELIGSASDAFRKVLDRAERDSQWLPSADARLQVRFELARSERMLGRFKESLDRFEELLKERPTMIDAQMEAARAYQQWAAKLEGSLGARAYATAISGGRPDSQTRQNILWGWGRIGRVTTGRAEFREMFFEARYQLALCRLLQSRKEPDAEQSTKLAEQAVRDISQVAALYPDLGGPDMSARFNALLREIQREAGQPVRGLAAFQQP